jgi:uncharacterized protein (DUF58 family)
MQYLRAIFPGSRLLAVGFGLAALAAIGHFISPAYALAWLGLGLLMGLLLMDAFLLFRLRKGLEAERILGERLSNGDDNPILVRLYSHYPYRLQARVYDELPALLQKRDLKLNAELEPGKTAELLYELHPTRRGIHSFGKLLVYLESPLVLIRRRYSFPLQQDVAVYPSFLQMRQYELLAFAPRPYESGLKKIRRLGQHTEFEQIKEYVAGDDYRTVNWKATARRGQLMVNTFQEEKAQPLYCFIDKGRLMYMPFQGLSLLDYAINASLAISKIALRKGDKVGLATYEDKPGVFITALNQSRQMQRLQEALYHLDTAFQDSDLSRLLIESRRHLSHRSLILLFTNFESVEGMRRQLPYLKQMARRHLVVVIFFENTELSADLLQPARDLHAVYTQGISEMLVHEKWQIVQELQRHGLHALLTPPEKLTLSVLNKYLELKARALI